jgi:hypothetical protein
MTLYLVTMVRGRGTEARNQRETVIRLESSDDAWKLEGKGWEVVACEPFRFPWEKR